MRLALVPVAAWLLWTGSYQVALAVVALAALTDLADGYLARRWGMASPLGAWLDPLADKALVTAGYLTLGLTGEIALWLTALVIGRDVLILAALGLALLAGRRIRIAPLFVSKLNTVVQLVFVTGVLALLALGIAAPEVVVAAQIVVAATTIASGGAYLVQWRRFLSEDPPHGP